MLDSDQTLNIVFFLFRRYNYKNTYTLGRGDFHQVGTPIKKNYITWTKVALTVGVGELLK